MYTKQLLALGVTGLLLTGFTAIDAYPDHTNSPHIQTLDREQAYEYELQGAQEYVHTVSEKQKAKVPEELLKELEAPEV